MFQIFDSKTGTWKCDSCSNESCTCLSSTKQTFDKNIDIEVPFVTPTLVEHTFK